MYFDGEIPDYRLIGTLNPDKTPETPDLSGLTRLGCLSYEHQIMYFAHINKKREYNVFCTHQWRS